MIKSARLNAIGLILLSVLTSPTSAFAAPLSFDCDVPSDHYSSISEDVSGPLMIGGSVQPVQMRSGNHLPVAGVRLVSPDGVNSVGFQLVAASPHAKQFDVLLNTKRGDHLKQTTVEQVDAASAVSFSLSLADTGKVTLLIGNMSFVADFIPIPSGNEMAFCSTGQFRFTGLLFSAAGASGTSVGH